MASTTCPEAVAALTAGRWADAEALAAADVAVDRSPELHEVLGEARWWLGRVGDAVAAWTTAHELAVAAGDTDTAVRLAAWVSREYAAMGNAAAAAGWRARITSAHGEVSAGWVALADAALATDPTEQRRHAIEAMAAARAGGDPDLQIAALCRLGLAHVRSGLYGEGLTSFDEAMAVATAGVAQRLRTVGEACCDLVLATELTGDVQRFAQWMAVVEDFVGRRGYPPVLGFCATCCAEADAMRGDFGGAEQQLRAAVVSLHETGQAPRCVPPTAKLAELLVLQGRLEEAEQVLGDNQDDDALVAGARLALARGDAGAAATLAQRAARRLDGDSLVKVTALALLVDAAIARADLDAAARACTTLQAAAEATSSPRAHARAAVARGRLAAAMGEDVVAAAAFEAALDQVAGVIGSIEGADAHLGMARLTVSTAPDMARSEAAAAAATYDSIGATTAVDEAAAMLRSLGHHSRVGVKGVGLLTQREQQVLRLLAEGLTNAEIGARLFISTKTAGNHVSSILSKLNLRSRAEAAAFAAQHGAR
jgi:DNA-binding CsgD family transcriptional regulator